MRMFFILIIMLVLHIFADFTLQGIMAQMKQYDWWKKEFLSNYAVDIEGTIYRKDYKAAMLCHSFEWAFCVTLPIMVSIWNTCTDFSWPNIRAGIMFICILIWNTWFHYFVDDTKANDKKCNLIIDQTLHAIQIFITWLSWTAGFGW